MNLLILFKLLKPTLRLDLLIKEAVISEILRMYGIAKYFIILLCVSLVCCGTVILLVFKDSLLLNKFLNLSLIILKISAVE